MARKQSSTKLKRKITKQRKLCHCCGGDGRMRRDEFKISDGNLLVLKDLMEMMTIPNYRRRLRMIVMEYHMAKQNKKQKK